MLKNILIHVMKGTMLIIINNISSKSLIQSTMTGVVLILIFLIFLSSFNFKMSVS